MKNLIGKKLGNVVFTETNGNVYGNIENNGVCASYQIKETAFKAPAEAVLMDLDGTTLTSEEFWVYIIERTMAKLMGNEQFSFTDEDIPFVSGFTTVEHLQYAIGKYCPENKTALDLANEYYHQISTSELKKISRGEGNMGAFKPTAGLKEFLLELKARKIKIGLATSGLDYKCIPEIQSVFRQLDLGDPLTFYDAVITGGRRKNVGDYGTLGEIVSKPHPWIYTELAYMGLKIKNPENVIGIEDSAAGVLSLRFAGFPVIGLETGNITQSGLNCLCDRKVNDLSEILLYI